jgi:hypothetical protein
VTGRDDRTHTGRSPDKINVEGGGATGRSDRTDISGASQDLFWRQRFADRDYVDPDRGYEYYRPAYRYGWEARERYSDRSYTDVAAELREQWDAEGSGLGWTEAEPAVRDAFERSATEWSDPGNPLA